MSRGDERPLPEPPKKGGVRASLSGEGGNSSSNSEREGVSVASVGVGCCHAPTPASRAARATTGVRASPSRPLERQRESSIWPPSEVGKRGLARCRQPRLLPHTRPRRRRWGWNSRSMPWATMADLDLLARSPSVFSCAEGRGRDGRGWGRERRRRPWPAARSV